jgi:hypothetical protein
MHHSINLQHCLNLNHFLQNYKFAPLSVTLLKFAPLSAALFKFALLSAELCKLLLTAGSIQHEVGKMHHTGTQQRVLLKYWYICTKLYGVISQKVILLYSEKGP